MAAAIAAVGLTATGAAPAHAASPMTPVVVMERASAGDGPEAAVTRLGGQVDRQLPIVRGFSARVPARSVAALRRQAGVLTVTRDRRMTVRSTEDAPVSPGASLAAARGTIGADRVAGDGRGVDVALLDTGVSPVRGLEGRVVNGPDLSGDGVVQAQRHLDGFGHGTHLAGIIAGTDPSSGFAGVAPGARVVNVRVADHEGATSLSRLLAGIDWVVRHGGRNGLSVRVLVIAVGGDVEGGYRNDPLAAGLEEAWRRGVAVVVAAGNDGNETTALGSPAHDPYLIAAGAVDDRGTVDPADDAVASFSSRGSAERTPDVLAPGVAIVSLRVPGGYLDQEFPQARIGEAWFRGSGTSQAAAVVGGAAAVLLGARPDLEPDELKALLRSSARPVAGADVTLQGGGTVDLAAAASLPTPDDVRQSWPRARTGGAWGTRRGASLPMAIEDPDAWRANTWRANTWRANTWRANTWRANTWRANTWRANTWRANTWRANTWRANTWRADGWQADSWATPTTEPGS